MPYPTGNSACSKVGVDDERRHIAATKRQLLERAASLLGRDELAQRLTVPSTLLESWVRGDGTMPDGKLMDLARVLDNVSREERALKGAAATLAKDEGKP